MKSLATSGEFTYITSSNASILDLEYYYNHSGDKSTSPMYDSLLGDIDSITTEVEDNALSQLAQVIIYRFKEKWDTIHTAFLEETYNPLTDYNLERTETPNITKTKDTTNKYKEDVTTTSDTENSVYGFNSSEAVGQSKSNSNGTTSTLGSATDNERNETETETGSRTSVVKGKLGYGSYSNYIKQELDLRQNFNFIEMIFKDIDSVLALYIYI